MDYLLGDSASEGCEMTVECGVEDLRNLIDTFTTLVLLIRKNRYCYFVIFTMIQG